MKMIQYRAILTMADRRPAKSRIVVYRTAPFSAAMNNREPNS